MDLSLLRSTSTLNKYSLNAIPREGDGEGNDSSSDSWSAGFDAGVAFGDAGFGSGGFGTGNFGGDFSGWSDSGLGIGAGFNSMDSGLGGGGWGFGGGVGDQGGLGSGIGGWGGWGGNYDGNTGWNSFDSSLGTAGWGFDGGIGDYGGFGTGVGGWGNIGLGSLSGFFSPGGGGWSSYGPGNFGFDYGFNTSYGPLGTPEFDLNSALFGYPDNPGWAGGAFGYYGSGLGGPGNYGYYDFANGGMLTGPNPYDDGSGRGGNSWIGGTEIFGGPYGRPEAAPLGTPGFQQIQDARGALTGPLGIQDTPGGILPGLMETLQNSGPWVAPAHGATFGTPPLDPYVGVQRSMDMPDPSVPVSPAVPYAPVAPAQPTAPPTNPFNFGPGTTPFAPSNGIFGITPAEAQTVGHPTLTPAQQYLADQMLQYYVDPQAHQYADFGSRFGEWGAPNANAYVSNVVTDPNNFDGRFGGPYPAPMQWTADTYLGDAWGRSGNIADWGRTPSNVAALDYPTDTFDSRFGGPYPPPAAPDYGPDVATNHGPAHDYSADVAGLAQGQGYPVGQVTNSPLADIPAPDTFDARFGDFPATLGWVPGEQLAGRAGLAEPTDWAQNPFAADTRDSFDSRFGGPYPEARGPDWTYYDPNNVTVVPQDVRDNFDARFGGPYPSSLSYPAPVNNPNARGPEFNLFGNPQVLFDRTFDAKTFNDIVPALDMRNNSVPLPVANPLDVDARTAPSGRSNFEAPSRSGRDNVETRGGRTDLSPDNSREAGRTAQTVTNAIQRGDPNSMAYLNALLQEARTAPTLAGRIAALDALNGIISAMKDAGRPNPFGRDPDPNIAAALRQGR